MILSRLVSYHLFSVLNHLGHPFLLGLKLSLVFLSFVLFPLLRGHFLDFLLFISDFLADFVLLGLIDLLSVLFSLSARHLFAIFLAFSSSLVREFDADNFVNDAKDNLEDFECVGYRLLSGSDLNLGAHEDIVLIVHLLVGHMELLQAATILLKQISHTLVNQLISNFLVFSKGDQVVDLALLSSLFLVGRGLGDGQIGCTHRVEKCLEVLMLVHGCLRARLLRQEKLNRVGRGHSVVTREQDWNVHCE